MLDSYQNTLLNETMQELVNLVYLNSRLILLNTEPCSLILFVGSANLLGGSVIKVCMLLIFYFIFGSNIITLMINKILTEMMQKNCIISISVMHTQNCGL